MRTNLLSDLGVQPQSAALWSGSVFVAGLLVVVGAFFLFDYGRSHRWPLTVFLLTGIGLMGLATFNEVAFTSVHLIFSLLAFLFGGISALVSFRIIAGPFRYLSVILGAVMVIGVIILFGGANAPLAATFFGLPRGFAERIVTSPETIWFIGFGAYLMASPSHERKTD
jgi:hypothetical membrane protein